MFKIGCHWQRYNTWVPKQWIVNVYNVFVVVVLCSFLTRELRACARASYRYDVGNRIRSLARSLARSIGRFL